MAPTSISDVVTGGVGLDFNPQAAVTLYRSAKDLQSVLKELFTACGQLSSVGGCGLYPSGAVIQKSLSDIGRIYGEAIDRLEAACDEISAAVKAAGLRLVDQDDQTMRDLFAALNSPDGSMPQHKPVPPPRAGHGDHTPPKQKQPVSVKSNPPPQPGTLGPTAADGADGAAGSYPVNAALEDVPSVTLESAVANLSPADGPALNALAQQWLQVANQLDIALWTFNDVFKQVLGSGSWSGGAADAIQQGATNFTISGKQIAQEATTNAQSIAHWGANVGHAKESLQQLAAAKPGYIASAPELAGQISSQYDEAARNTISWTYNPGVLAVAGGVSNISDPHNPVASAPLFLPGTGPAPAVTNTPAAAPGSGAGPSSGGNGTTKSSGGTGGAGNSASDQAAALTRKAQGDANVAAKAGGSPAGGPAAAGNANPASSAQSTLSKAGDAAKGLTGAGAGKNGLGTAATKSASALANAEKAAAEKAAKAAAGLGKGGGGGGAGGGMGGAAAAEKALQARAGSMGAAEKMVAAEQAALQNGRAGAPGAMGGAPMGGARPGGEGGEGKGHKAARYLNSKANGEEIVGDEQEVAPTVIGGLNLDTTDDRPSEVAVRGAAPLTAGGFARCGCVRTVCCVSRGACGVRIDSNRANRTKPCDATQFVRTTGQGRRSAHPRVEVHRGDDVVDGGLDVAGFDAHQGVGVQFGDVEIA